MRQLSGCHLLPRGTTVAVRRDHAGCRSETTVMSAGGVNSKGMVIPQRLLPRPRSRPRPALAQLSVAPNRSWVPIYHGAQHPPSLDGPTPCRNNYGPSSSRPSTLLRSIALGPFRYVQRPGGRVGFCQVSRRDALPWNGDEFLDHCNFSCDAHPFGECLREQASQSASRCRSRARPALVPAGQSSTPWSHRRERDNPLPRWGR